jgi:hypothetical protein
MELTGLLCGARSISRCPEVYFIIDRLGIFGDLLTPTEEVWFYIFEAPTWNSKSLPV